MNLKKKQELRKEKLADKKAKLQASKVSLKDILGDSMPKRVCKHCGKRAYSDVDLQEFVYAPSAKHDRKEVCKGCSHVVHHYTKLGLPYSIVGSHEPWAPKKICLSCGLRVSHRDTRTWFSHVDTSISNVCKICMDTHVVVMGKPICITSQNKAIPIVAIAPDGTTIEYPSINKASLGTSVSINRIRSVLYRLIPDSHGYHFKIKEHND